MNPSKNEEIAEKVLASLRDKINQVVPVVELLSTLKLEMKFLQSAVSQLQEWGYGITLTPNDICLISIPDILSDIEIKYHLRTDFIGCEAACYGSVKSTNDIAKEKAENGATHGTVIIADQQTKGRGRFGRSWQSPPGCGASISIILRPDFPPEKAPGISLIVALALSETLSKYCPSQVKIKWPNDVLISGKKVAGILNELSADKNKIDYLVIGVGININQTSDDFIGEIKDIATSVRMNCKKKINRAELVGGVLNQLEKEYLEYSENFLKNSLNRLRKYSSLIGQSLSVLSGNKKITGKVVDINPDGALVVDQNGELIALSCGEVTILKNKLI